MKLKWGSLVVAGSGKIGGHVASKNRGGSYLRTKTTPINPQTSSQMASRAILSQLSQGWGALTQEQRNGWNGAVSDFSSTDIFGDIRNPSGQNLFVQLNTNLLNSNQGILSIVPTKVEVPTPLFNKAQFDVSASTLDISFTSEIADGSTVLIYATPPLPPGRKYAKNRFRLIGYSIVDGFNLQDSAVVYSFYASKFGAVSLGQNIQVAYRVVTETGQVSPLQKVTAIIVP